LIPIPARTLFDWRNESVYIDSSAPIPRIDINRGE